MAFANEKRRSDTTVRWPTRVAAALAVLTCSCATPRTVAVQQASFDHRCPEEKISVLRTSDDRRSLELDVCGTSRRYQDLLRDGLTWVDVTGGGPCKAADPSTVPAQATAAPGGER